MSHTHNTCFVIQATLGDGTTYYMCSNSRVGGITLDSNEYNPFILSIGDAEKIGNFGEGSARGTCSVNIMFGQKQYGDSYNLNISKPWNNGVCVIKIYDIDNDTAWTDCEDYFYGVIKNFKISYNMLEFSVEEINTKDNMILPKYTAEDYLDTYSDGMNVPSDVPEDSRGKRIPMQYGDLTSTSNGIFAKGLLLSNKIGSQKVIFDSRALYLLNNMGIWETGLKRYFAGKATEEYDIVIPYNIIEFKIDSFANLDEDITDSVETFLVDDYSYLQWSDESDYDDIDKYPEILTINIIAIDSELMLLVQQPDSLTIRVERGYGGSIAAAHTKGANIYQSSKLSSKNLMSFTERFYPKAVSNFCYSSAYTTVITGGKWSDLVDSDYTNYVQVKNKFNSGQSIVNFDLKFEKVEQDFSVFNSCLDLKVYCEPHFHVGLPNYMQSIIRIMSTTTDYNSYCRYTNGDELCHAGFVIMVNRTGSFDTTFAFDSTALTETEQRTSYNSTYYKFAPDLLSTTNLGYNDPINGDETIQQQALVFKDLNALNEKWKVNVWISPGANGLINFYRIGFLVDFFTSFVDKRIVSSLKGRKVTAYMDTVLGTSSAGNQITLVLEVLLDLLINEMDYSPSDFDTTSWQSALSYYANFETEGLLQIKLSYGIDEKEKGWDLCQKIAADHLLMLTKTDSGKIKIIDLHQLQNTDYVIGYRSISKYKISIDDIIVSGGKRLLQIQQTGTDRIRNVVKIKYNRNNSTDEYMNTFPGGENNLYTSDWLDTNHILPESGVTLSSARTTYYSGQKTEDWEIEAFSVYGYTQAYRLWQWHINDKAEVFFYLTVTIPYYHYSDTELKTEQYDIGDLIYIDGLWSGLTLSMSHLWVIRRITKSDNGKEVTIEAKSIDPVSEF